MEMARDRDRDRGSRKRKIWAVNADIEEDDEETKMEKFCALIQRLGEARELQRRRAMKNQNGCPVGADIDIQMKNNIKGSATVWEPKFEVEDFAQEASLVASFTKTSKRGELAAADQTQKKQETPQGLDLRLSL